MVWPSSDLLQRRSILVSIAQLCSIKLEMEMQIGVAKSTSGRAPIDSRQLAVVAGNYM